MNGTEIILALFIARLVVPFGLLLLVGELVRRRHINYWLKS
jgi:hypothetical protein